MNPPELNPETGRTVIFRGSSGEVVLSSSYETDNLKDMVEIVEGMIKSIVKKGGEISYVN